MANPTLPSATSVVDYLKSQGKDSSYSARSKLYREAGLDKTLGEYVGSASQNTNLLKMVQSSSNTKIKQTQTPSFTSTPALDITKNMGMKTTTPAISPNVKSPIPAPSPTPAQAPTVPTNLTSLTPLLSSILPQQKDQSSNVLSQYGFPGYAGNIGKTQPAPTPAPQAPGAPKTASTYTGGSIVDFLNSTGQKSDFSTRKALAEKNGITNYQGTAAQNTQLLNTLRGGQASQQPTGSPEVQASKSTDTQTGQSTGGVSASTIYPGLTDEDPKESDLVNTWLNSAEGKLFLDRQELAGMNAEAKAESAKAELEAKYESEKSSLEEKLAENGLAFSGIRGTKVKALADSLAASTLSVDREFASKLLDANLDLREAILKGVAELAKEAQDGRKEAIQQLNAIGYAVINGELVPTLAARSAERADRSLEISEARLALSEQAAVRAEQRFEQLYGQGKNDGFDYLRQLMELNPNASRAELLAAALENTDLSTTEANAVLDTVGLTPNQMTETAKALVASNWEDMFFGLKEGKEVTAARKKAKDAIRATGGVLKVGGRTVTLSSDQLAELERYIDTVTGEEATQTKKLLDKK